MFLLATLRTELALSPRDMGRRLQQMIETRLVESVEGKVHGTDGYVIAVSHIKDSWKGAGILDDSTGAVTYQVEFEAIVLRPLKGETLDAVVSYVTEHGLVCWVGPLQVFVAKCVAAAGGGAGANPLAVTRFPTTWS
jgi:DNA-directed RNA polymerase II subunit RPB7